MCFPQERGKHVFFPQRSQSPNHVQTSIHPGCAHVPAPARARRCDGLFLHRWQLAFPLRGKLRRRHGHPTHRYRPLRVKVSTMLQGQPCLRAPSVCRVPAWHLDVVLTSSRRSISFALFRHFPSIFPNNPSIQPYGDLDYLENLSLPATLAPAYRVQGYYVVCM